MTWICPNGCVPAEFIASVYETAPTHAAFQLRRLELGVLVYPDGRPTNRWEDGTAGVPDELKEQAAEAEEVYCPICGEGAEWR